MTKDSRQQIEAPKQFRIGPLGNLSQVVKALGKTIRAMADGSIDSQLGARICNGLGIMRACLETASLERLEERLGELEGGRSYGNGSDDRQALRPH
jgi:hypothetical protein